MKQNEIPTDDPLEMIWAIREKHYEETKNMTLDEQCEYTRKKVESFYRRMNEIKCENQHANIVAK